MPAPKPPRVYIKGGKFYIAYWLKGRDLRRSTGLDVDEGLEFEEDNPQWWHPSVHKDEIERKLEISVANRTSARHGSSQVLGSANSLAASPSLGTLFFLYAEEWKKSHDDIPLEQGTKKKFITSINSFRKFNKYLGILNTTPEDARNYRKWLRKHSYEDITAHSYVRRLKTLWKFAIKKDYCLRNPWLDVVISYEDKIIIPAPVEELKRFFCVAFKDNRPAFELSFFQRMTAYRFSDSIRYTDDSIEYDTLILRNVKMKRPDPYPICEALGYMFKQMEKKKGKLFAYNNVQKYNEALKEISAIAGVRKLTSKSFKPNFGQELDEALIDGHPIDDRFIALLMHHKVTGHTRVASRHYIQHLPQMRRILNAVFTHWLHFIEGLYTDYDAECRKWEVNL